MQKKNELQNQVSIVVLMVVGCLCQTLVLVSCVSATKHSSAPAGPNPQVGSVMSDEVSLKADRSELDELRKDIPAEIKKENDEIALILQMIKPDSAATSDEDPSKIRERFNKALRDRRAKVDKELRKKRDEFTKAEKDKRDKFMSALKDDRDKYLKGKNTTQRNREFFNEQDKKRNEYFAEERDTRKEFESQMTAARKEFDDYAREKQNFFNQEYRAYTATYHDRRRALDLKKRNEAQAASAARSAAFTGAQASESSGAPGVMDDPNSEMSKLREEFRRIPSNIPATPLRAGKGN